MGNKELFDKQNEYNRMNYDRIGLMLPKGSKDRLQEFAKAHGMSLNQLFSVAVDEYIKARE